MSYNVNSWGGDSAASEATKKHMIDLGKETARIEAERKLGAPYTPQNSWPDRLGWAPHPDRPVSSHWSKIPVSVDFVMSDPDSRMAADAKLRRAGLTNTKARLLKPVLALGKAGQMLERGSVVELTPTGYADVIGTKAWEPVPADTPVKEITRVPIPSDLSEARQQAAAGMKKDASTLTIADIWRFFAKPRTDKDPIGYITEIPT